MTAIAIAGAALALVFLATAVLLVGSERQRSAAESAFEIASFKQAFDQVGEYCADSPTEMVRATWLLTPYANDREFANLPTMSTRAWLLNAYANIKPFRPDSPDNALIEYRNPDPSTARRLRQSKWNEISEHDLSRHREEDRLARAAVFHALLTMGRVEKADTKLLEPSGPYNIIPIIPANEDEFEVLRDLSLYGHCSWTFWKRPAPGTLRLLGSMFWPAGHLESRFDPDDPIHDDLFGFAFPRMGWDPDPIYWNAWRGTHHFTFTHAKAEYPLSVWIPVSTGPDFVQRVMAVALFIWVVLAFALGAGIVWWRSKPLRTLALNARAAGKIIETDDGVQGKLKSLADGLPSRTGAFREMKMLLHGMSSLLEERERWMGDVVHQLKNNLAVFSVNLRKLRAAGSGDAAGPFGSELEEIDKAADMIRGTLESVEVYQWALFGRPEEKARLDLDSMLDTIADEIEDLGGEVSISYATRRPLNVHGRRTALMSALQNLIWNAHVHGGAIEVRVELTDGGRKVVITIDDDGPGIDDDIDEILKPYRRGRNPRGHGAGLGLAIASGVISDHGGEIAVSNREAADGSRAGLRVCVALPLNS